MPSRRDIIAALAAGATATFARQAIAQLAPSPVIEPQQGRLARLKHDAPIKDGKMARGDRTIRAAWFSDATQRYRHFALGADYEPAALVVSTADHRAIKFTLPDDSVFEDREPRIVDIDGVDMVMAVRTYLKKGAALALLTVNKNKLEIVTETPPIGAPFKWLNPIGPANFVGDGILQIALVRTPHLDGELQLWTPRNGEMIQTFAIEDVCNHALRSPFMKLHAIADFNGDGVPDLAVPTQDRNFIRFLSFRGNRVREFARVQLPAVAAEDFKVITKDGAPAVQVGLAGGRVFVVQA